jgi:CubicO group peptidase (beta-lactamase class C family)
MVVCAAALVVPCFAEGRISDELKQVIRDRVDRGAIVGIVVGVIDEGGREYFAYGKMDATGEHTPDEDTVFEIGSITKTFTAILLADMVERGEVSLDDPIDGFLPKDTKAPSRGGKPIRLIDLATHRSSLPRMPSNFRPADPRNPYADYSAERMFEFLADHSLRRDIGTKYEYSNLGFGLLATLLARQADSTFDDLIEARITKKLAMPDTRAAPTPQMKQRLATGHRGERAVSSWDFQAFAGAGALRSTVKDMLTYLAANMGLTDTPLLPAMKRTHERRHDAGSPKMAIGLAWHIRLAGEHEIIWHNGGTGGYRSFAGFVPGQKRGIVILTNSSHDKPDGIGFHWLDPKIPLQNK